MGLGQFARYLVASVMALALYGNSTVGLAQAPVAAPPPVVETAVVKLAPVTRQAEFVGTVVPVQQVDLRARVEGFLTAVNFSEGSFVKAGSKLFEIEKDTYRATLEGVRATLAVATAAVAGAEANLKQAELTLTRQSELVRTSAVAQSVVDQATASRDAAAAQVKQAQAQMAQAEAQIKSAELSLSFTDITTPISGRIGKAQLTVGNLVSATTGPLATVVQTDPIRVVFSISDREYLHVANELKPGALGFEASAPRFQPRLRLSDGTAYASVGKIASIDTSIDRATGTIAVYAEFPNPHLQLISGQYVSVTVQEGEAQQIPVVSAVAVQQDRDGGYVFVLGEGNRATIRRVKLGERVGTDWSVASGLASGDVVIVSGIQRIKAGLVVAPRAAVVGN